MSERHEERIDNALSVLREARAPEGMEARVLAAVRTREVAAPSTQSAVAVGGWSGARGGLVWCGAAAAVVVLGGLLAVLRYEAPVAGGSVADGAGLRGPAVTHEARPAAEVGEAAEPAAKPAVHVERVRQTRRSIAVTREVARSDADLPSFPAPPAPLTQQERLLLRVVRSGDRVELAMLDPAIRSARVEEEKAEVRKFFGEVTETELTAKEEKQ